ncbi:hypothetical protein SAMN04487884_104106 [Butyrivibrio fibrisolvens]|jgi:hypothetical protein|uniref:Uncharacterized protein n=1 Tax=Butyrivibrio fibrisolvens TaxID=831 RepID=A0A1H9NAJ3_BUTFI|nr:hypothetical protein [Butyrivibrio fibrisolvens]SER32695.1 hypothetical protein SAMN04487884_104106 [Butyrivibrio fibrisolvens]
MNTLTFFEFIKILIELFKYRNVKIFNVGIIICLVSVLLYKFFKRSKKTKIKATLIVCMIVGMCVTLLSFSHGDGWIPFARVSSENVILTANQKLIIVRGKNVFMNDEEVNLSEFDDYITNTYVEGTEYVVCDDYAENSTYDYVISFLKENYISVIERIVK